MHLHENKTEGGETQGAKLSLDELTIEALCRTDIGLLKRQVKNNYLICHQSFPIYVLGLNKEDF